MSETIQVLLIEDNEGDVLLLRETLGTVQEFRHELHSAGTLGDGRRLCRERRFDVLLLDLSLPDSTGLQTVSGAMEFAANLPIIVMTSLDDEELGMAAIRNGVQDYLIKGQPDGRALARAIRYAIEHKRARMELQKARDELEDRVRERTAELEQTLVALQEEFDERIRASQQVEEHRDVFRKISDLIPYGMWISDAAGGLSYVTPSLLEMAGTTLDQCRRMGWFECMDIEDRQRVKEEWVRCVSGGEPWDRTLRIRARDGSIRIVLSRGAPIRDRTGKISSYAGLNLDITDRR